MGLLTTKLNTDKQKFKQNEEEEKGLKEKIGEAQERERKLGRECKKGERGRGRVKRCGCLDDLFICLFTYFSPFLFLSLQPRDQMQ